MWAKWEIHFKRVEGSANDTRNKKNEINKTGMDEEELNEKKIKCKHELVLSWRL